MKRPLSGLHAMKNPLSGLLVWFSVLLTPLTGPPLPPPPPLIKMVAGGSGLWGAVGFHGTIKRNQLLIKQSNRRSVFSCHQGLCCMPAWIAVIFPGSAKYRHCCFSHGLEMTASCAAIFCLFLFCSSVFLSFSLGLVVVAKADTANALGQGFEIIVAFKLLSTAILRCEFLLPHLCQSLMYSCFCFCVSLFFFLIETRAGKGLRALSFHFFRNCCQNLQVHSLAIPVSFLYVEFVLVIFMCALVESGIWTVKLFIRAGPWMLTFFECGIIPQCWLHETC